MKEVGALKPTNSYQAALSAKSGSSASHKSLVLCQSGGGWVVVSSPLRHCGLPMLSATYEKNLCMFQGKILFMLQISYSMMDNIQGHSQVSCKAAKNFASFFPDLVKNSSPKTTSWSFIPTNSPQGSDLASSEY